MNEKVMNEQDFRQFIDEKVKGAKPLFIAIRGSQAYGTQLPTSDIDYSGVYIQQKDDIFGFGYKEQISDEKNDLVLYEIKRFLELLQSANPNILEMLFMPEDCIIYKDPIFDLILKNKDLFLTKQCKNSFTGYGFAQIKKAKGLNKKQNWEKEKITRKDILDFVFVLENEKAIPWKKWNTKYDEKFIGAVNVPHANEVYALYYDEIAYNCFSEQLDEKISYKYYTERKESGKPMGLGYKGLVKVGESENLGLSNQLRLSSIPKGEKTICNIIYQKDAYSQHCKEYKEYQEWLDKRNVQRYIDVKNHEQQIDGKNMMHCTRLIGMSYEIASGKGVIVRRPDTKYLISIRKGEVDLQTLIDNVEVQIKEIDMLFDNSNLPTDVDKEVVNDLLLKVRREYYQKRENKLKRILNIIKE